MNTRSEWAAWINSEASTGTRIFINYYASDDRDSPIFKRCEQFVHNGLTWAPLNRDPAMRTDLSSADVANLIVDPPENATRVDVKMHRSGMPLKSYSFIPTDRSIMDQTETPYYLRWLEANEIDGAVVKFKVAFPRGLYSYAALYVKGKGWYITGDSGDRIRFSSQELFDTYLKGKSVRNFSVLSPQEGNDMKAPLTERSLEMNQIAAPVATSRNYDVAKILKRAQEFLEKREEYEEELRKNDIAALKEALAKIEEENDLPSSSFNSLHDEILREKDKDLVNKYNNAVRNTSTVTYEKFIANLELLDDETIVLSQGERNLLDL